MVYGDKRLDGKSIVVVGAGSRVAGGWSHGKASAVVYAREGAFVMCVDYHLGRAEETARLIASEGGKAIALRADATNEADMQAVVVKSLEYTGRVDVMHNGVGVGRSRQDIISAYTGTRVAAPAMCKQGGGIITNISSLFAVRFGKRATMAYTVGKAGVEALTRSCAASYARDNIRVNCVRVDVSETPLSFLYLGSNSLAKEEQRKAQPGKTRRRERLCGEHGSPFDVGRACAFLASDLAHHISGVVLSVGNGSECTLT